MQGMELDEFKMKWKVLSNHDMPPEVQKWTWLKLDSAMRLLAAGLVVWSDKRKRLVLSRDITTDDQSHWNDCIRCEVVL